MFLVLHLKSHLIIIPQIDEFLLDRNPKMVAAGVVHYHLDKMGMSTVNMGKRMGITNPQSRAHCKIIQSTISEFKKKQTIPIINDN